MWADLRYSVRTLAKHPGFVLVAVTVLALGIGLNTALFSVVNAVLFRPLPVLAPEQLVYLYEVYPRFPDRPQVTGGELYEFLRGHNEAFSSLTGHWGISLMLIADGETDSTRGEWVFSNWPKQTDGLIVKGQRTGEMGKARREKGKGRSFRMPRRRGLND